MASFYRALGKKMTQGTEPRVLLRKQAWAVSPLPKALPCCLGAGSGSGQHRPENPTWPTSTTGAGPWSIAPALCAYTAVFLDSACFLSFRAQFQCVLLQDAVCLFCLSWPSELTPPKVLPLGVGFVVYVSAFLLQ